MKLLEAYQCDVCGDIELKRMEFAFTSDLFSFGINLANSLPEHKLACSQTCLLDALSRWICTCRTEQLARVRK